jgi:hypothetical protein
LISNDEELRRKARKTAEAKAGFYIHLGVYVVVNSLLIAIWWGTGAISGVTIFPWFIFPLFGWGAGLVAHFVGAFRGPAYVERQTEEEYLKLKRQEEPVKA